MSCSRGMSSGDMNYDKCKIYLQKIPKIQQSNVKNIKRNSKFGRTGTLKPENPSRTFDFMRQSYIMQKTTNLNTAPLHYVGKNPTNILMSGTKPCAFAIMRFGNNNLLVPQSGNTFQHPVVNLTVDARGNYKLVNDMGKSFNVYSNSTGNFFRFKGQKFYI